QSAVGAPNPDRVLAVKQTLCQLHWQVIPRCRFEALFRDPRFEAVDRRPVLGILDAVEQRLVFGATQRHCVGLSRIVPRYASFNQTVSFPTSVGNQARLVMAG